MRTRLLYKKETRKKQSKFLNHKKLENNIDNHQNNMDKI
jgi:hypothetical protein